MAEPKVLNVKIDFNTNSFRNRLDKKSFELLEEKYLNLRHFIKYLTIQIEYLGKKGKMILPSKVNFMEEQDVIIFAPIKSTKDKDSLSVVIEKDMYEEIRDYEGWEYFYIEKDILTKCLNLLTLMGIVYRDEDSLLELIEKLVQNIQDFYDNMIKIEKALLKDKKFIKSMIYKTIEIIEKANKTTEEYIVKGKDRNFYPDINEIQKTKRNLELFQSDEEVEFLINKFLTILHSPLNEKINLFNINNYFYTIDIPFYAMAVKLGMVYKEIKECNKN